MSYFSTDLTRHKLILLYFLRKSGFALREEQLLRLMIDNEWLDYFSFSQAIADLLEHEMITKDQQSAAIEINKHGLDALDAFEARLPQSTRDEIDSYAEKNQRRVRMNAQHEAHYERIGENEYIATLRILEDERELMKIDLNLVSREAAQSICSRWESKAHSLYAEIIGQLTEV